MNRTSRLIVAWIFLFFMALSTGNLAFWLPSILFAIVFIFAFLSVNLSYKTVKITQTLDESLVKRGNQVKLSINAQYSNLLPIAPVKLWLKETANMTGDEIILNTTNNKNSMYYLFNAIHVGLSRPGVDYCEVSDIFGLFTKKITPENENPELCVSPNPFTLDVLKFSSGDTGTETMKQAMEDPSSPSGTRQYRPGDPLKKIHWKLSLRKNELMVRQYDKPTLPKALLMVDLSPPHVSKQSSKQTVAFLKDAVLETAASVVMEQAKHNFGIQMPLMGSKPFLFDDRMGEHTLLDKLAHVEFNETDRFERVLSLETFKMKEMGAIAIITTRLSSMTVEMLIQMSMLGPLIRLYIVTYASENPIIMQMVQKLQKCNIEVCYVTPESVVDPEDTVK